MSTTAKPQETVNPKKIEYTVTSGENKGLLFRSIYTLDAGNHKICSDAGNNNRPKEFSGNAGFLRVTKRDKNGPPEVLFDSGVFATDLKLAESKEAIRRVNVKVRPGDGGVGTLKIGRASCRERV